MIRRFLYWLDGPALFGRWNTEWVVTLYCFITRQKKEDLKW